MGIVVKNKEVVAISYGERVIAAVYRGAKLIWMAVSSCFGAGYWDREKGWSREEAWRRDPR